MSLMMNRSPFSSREQLAAYVRSNFAVGSPERAAFEATPWDILDQQYGLASPSGGLVAAPGMANLSWGGIGDVFGKIGDAIGVLTGGSRPPAGPMPKFPSAPGGPPMIPAGAGGLPPLPTGMTFPGGGTDEMGLGDVLGKIGGAVGRTAAGGIGKGVAAGIIGEWIYDTVKGWIFKPKKRHRRMNVLNPRALVRADRRVTGFAHYAKKELSRFGYHVQATRKLKHKSPALPRRAK